MAKKYDTALKLARHGRAPSRKVYDLLLAADGEDDARATYALATRFLSGNKFCKKDFRRAAQMLERAAKADIPSAVFDLAVSYEKGKGVKKSLRSAFRLYVKAALLGDPLAPHEVGRMYYYGIGTGRDAALADIWLARAERATSETR